MFRRGKLIIIIIFAKNFLALCDLELASFRGICLLLSAARSSAALLRK